jgi:ATP-dependent 26S proteasome regulatory subunit
LVTIITTNHIDKLDEALLRTGRIDLKIEVPKPSHKEISQYMSLFFERPIEIQGDFSITMSDVQDICLKNRHNPEEAIQRINSKINLEIVK